MTIDSPVRVIPKVGPDYSKRLRENGIETVGDLLLHVPFRYDDLRKPSTTRDFPQHQLTFFEGTVFNITPVGRGRGKSMFKGLLKDKEGELSILWFNSQYVLTAFKKDKPVRLIGKVETFNGVPTLMSPTWETVAERSPHIGRLVPVYHEFNGVTTKWLRSRMWDVLHTVSLLDDELIPEQYLHKRELLSYPEIWHSIHFPSDEKVAERAKHRLAYEELFKELLRQALLREERIASHTTAVFTFSNNPLLDPFLDTLPFALSDSQKQSLEEMFKDMSQGIPMSRMLVGDVGSGKTVVAAGLAYATHLAGMRSVVMAPTQILAKQHYDTLHSFLSQHHITLDLVSGGDVRGKKRDNITGDVVIGTHALLHRDTLGPSVGLVVVDEQHRFGVNQRERLKELVGSNVHLLSMTATPIPRSLSLLLLGHLDVSYLFKREGGRQDALTKVVPHAKRLTAYRWVQEYIKQRGGQAFVVCPFIEPSETIATVKAAAKEFEYLRDEVFTELRVRLLHGGMKAEEKDQILREFREGAFEVLVTTPVVEVGIDIPQANFILIESAERFGLAQLHQLRGRVGRAGQEAFCFLIPSTSDKDENQRLQAMTTTHDGYALAEIDLSYRGSGTIFGTLQSGFSGFRFATIENRELLGQVKEDVDEVLVEIKNGCYIDLKKKLGLGIEYGRH